MKKLILSFVVIAASGAYVALGNGSPAASQPNAADQAALPTVAQQSPTQIGAAPVTDPVLPRPAAASQAPAPAVPDPVQVAEATDPLPPIASLSDESAPDPVSAAAAPPVPLPRPAEAPQPAIEVAQVPGQYKDGTYRGPSEDAYYGRVQVQAIVSGGQISSVRALQYPNDRGRSIRINNYALPELEQEVVQAQSADVDTVSGATLTSDAYIKSLRAALQKAGS